MTMNTEDRQDMITKQECLRRAIEAASGSIKTLSFSGGTYNVDKSTMSKLEETVNQANSKLQAEIQGMN